VTPPRSDTMEVNKEPSLRYTDFLGHFEHSGMVFESTFEHSGDNFGHILNIS